MKKLTNVEINNELSNLSDWQFIENSLTRTVEFSTYMKSIEFINLLATEAEKMEHHPDLQVGWRRITINYSTHDIGGITDLDIDMARRTNNIIETYQV